MNTNAYTIFFPSDPASAVRTRGKARASAPPEKRHAFAQFLKYDRQVLKFQAYWDDRTDLGDVRKLEICYYLADDTMEVKEAQIRNSGRDGPKTFLKRARLQRVSEDHTLVDLFLILLFFIYSRNSAV